MATICVIYHSDTGNTHTLARRLAEGAELDGVEVRLLPADRLDLDAAAAADALAVGSPDYFNYVAGSVKTFFDRILHDERFRDKPYVAFGTTGAAGEVVAAVEGLAGACGLRRVAPGLAVRGRPDEAEAYKAYELGKALAGAVAEAGG